jgi:hypothetical protein
MWPRAAGATRKIHIRFGFRERRRIYDSRFSIPDLTPSLQLTAVGAVVSLAKRVEYRAVRPQAGGVDRHYHKGLISFPLFSSFSTVCRRTQPSSICSDRVFIAHRGDDDTWSLTF